MTYQQLFILSQAYGSVNPRSNELSQDRIEIGKQMSLSLHQNSPEASL